MSEDDDEKTVVVSNCSKGGRQHKALTAQLAMNYVKNTDKMFNTLHIKIAMDMEIADAGATGHFLLPGTQETNLKSIDKPLTTNLPYVTQIK